MIATTLLLKHTVESQFLEPSRETKIGSKNSIFPEIGVKLQCSTEKRGTTFGPSYRGGGGVGKKKHSRNEAVHQ